MIGRNACLHTHIHQQLGTDKGIKPGGCHNQLPSDASSQKTLLTLVDRKYQGKRALKERERSREQGKRGLFYFFLYSLL